MASSRRILDEWVDMHAYQEDAVQWMLDRPFSQLWAGMGLGKTMVNWTMIRDLLVAGRTKRVLVIAPLKVATQTWPNETESWEHLMDMQYAVLRHKDRAVREQLFHSPAPVHIVNREMVTALVDYWKGLKRWPYDAIIIDESSSFKDHNTARFKSLKLVRNYVKRFHNLTATPAAESYMGLFAQTYLIDKGERFGNSIEHFRNTYFDHDPWAKRYTIKDGADNQIIEKLADITLVIREEDHFDIEKPLRLQRRLHMEPDQLRAYNDFEKKAVLALPEGRIEALSAAALSQKLLQASSGAVYDENKKPIHFHDHKIEDLEEVVEELDGSPILVPYWWQSSRQRLLAAFPQAKALDREGKLVGDWNEGRIPILLVHPQSAGHGLNMQYGPGHTIYFFDMPWSGELYEQVIKRIARQGQKRLVRVHHAIMEETEDDRQFNALQAKGDEQRDLIERVKKLREKWVNAG